jgi:hypothetical protein
VVVFSIQFSAFSFRCQWSGGDVGRIGGGGGEWLRPGWELCGAFRALIGGAAVVIKEVVKAAVAGGTIKVASFGRAECGAAFLAVSEWTLAVRTEWGQLLAAVMAFFAKGLEWWSVGDMEQWVFYF